MSETSKRGVNLDFLQYFLDASPNGVMIFESVKNGRGDIIDFVWRLANLKSSQMLQYSENTLLGKRFLNERRGDDSREIFKLALQVMEQGKTIEHETAFDTESWYMLGISRLDENLIITMKDFSQQKRASLESESRHEELDRFFNLALDLMTVATTDGYLLKINKAWEYCLGYSMENIQGKSYYDFVHPDDIEATLKQTDKLSKQEPVLNFVNRYRTIDGTYRYIQWRAQPFGKFIYAAGRDITEARIAEEALRESEEQFRALFEQSNDAVFIFDLAGTNKAVNQRAATLLGYSREELLKLGTRDVSAEVDETFNVFSRLLNGETIEPYERLFRHKDGSLIPVEINIALVRDEDGKALHFQSIVRDIRERKRVEQDLKERERQFRALFEQSNDAVFLLDFSGHHQLANRKASELLGYSIEELQAMGVQDISADLHSSANVLQRLLAGERITPYERLFRHKDGSLIPVEINVELVHDESGKPIHIQSVVRDIRERKKAEAILEAKLEEELRFQEYLKNLQDIVIELTAIKEMDDFYRRAVELGLERFGFERLGLILYDEPDALGTYGTDPRGKLIPEHDLRFDPRSMTTILWRALQRDEHFVYDEDADLYSNYEIIGRGQNAVAVLWNGENKLGWLAIDNAVNSGEITQAQLEILALYALSLGNLLAQRKIQESLRQSEMLYRSIVTMMAEGLVLQDSNGKIITANAAAERILGIKSADLMGGSADDGRWRPIREDGTAFEVEQHPSVITLRTGKPMSNVIMGLIRPDGETVWVMVNTEPLFQANQTKPYAVVVTFSDISRRIKAQQQALELQLEKERIKVLSNFIQGSSHEFRTPLAIIKSNIYLLKRLDDPERRLEKANSIELQIERILTLLMMLNKMSQLDSHVSMKLQTCDVYRMLGHIVQQMQMKLEAKQLVLKLEGESVLVYGNEEFLFDAFSQLIQNAIQFSKPAGEIRVNCRRDGEFLRLSIEDDGEGISEDVLPHIFERFFRVDVAHSTAGFGLGLPLAQSVIEQHGGDIRVETELGKGSRFEVLLPVDEAKE